MSNTTQNPNEVTLVTYFADLAEATVTYFADLELLHDYMADNDMEDEDIHRITDANGDREIYVFLPDGFIHRQS